MTASVANQLCVHSGAGSEPSLLEDKTRFMMRSLKSIPIPIHVVGKKRNPAPTTGRSDVLSSIRPEPAINAIPKPRLRCRSIRACSQLRRLNFPSNGTNSIVAKAARRSELVLSWNALPPADNSVLISSVSEVSYPTPAAKSAPIPSQSVR